jgi:transposase
MLNSEEIEDILIYNRKIDFRKNIDGLSQIVEQEMGEDVFSKTLYLFFSKNRKKIKILYWDRNGFCLWQKRLDKEKFKLPKDISLKSILITREQLEWMLSGYDFWKQKPFAVLDYKKIS